ncbi:hypothetical protein UlMin_027079 [Ulmus minor]
MLPCKKKIRRPSSEAPCWGVLIPGLPNDIATNCLARVPRWHHPVLSAVSKPIRSLLSSPHFFNTRSLSNLSENLIYLTIPLENPFENPIKLFAHHPKSNLLRLAPMPPCPRSMPTLHYSAYAALGPKIYAISVGDPISGSKQVWIFDCRFRTWERGPDMLFPQFLVRAVVFDGKIYAFGQTGMTQNPGADFLQVFDPVIGYWEIIPGPTDIEMTCFTRCVVVGDTICCFWRHGGLVFYPRTRTWETLPSELIQYKNHLLFGMCEIDGVLYRFDGNGRMFGCDERNREWKEIPGVMDHLVGFNYSTATELVNRGGRVFLMWKGDNKGKTTFRCAEIEVEKTEGGELLGKVHWADELVSFPFGLCLGQLIPISF